MIRRILILGLTLAMPLAAIAQEQRGPNGGRVVVADGHPVEFVPNGAELVFYLRDDDRAGSPMRTRGLTGRAVVQQGGQTITVQLAGAEPNRMVGQMDQPLAPGARVVFSASAGGHRLQARFTND